MNHTSSRKPGLKSLLGRDSPLLLPCAHDALSARLIEQAGFDAFSIGGFGVISSRLGLPDVGLASFGEISSAVRDITAVTRLPALIDADDGYGDVKNVTRTVQVYEAMGVSGIVLEDQTNPKRCGHMAGKQVVSPDLAVRKLDAALAARSSSDFMIVARTDARGVHGMDDALQRGERFIRSGVDALFIEAPQSVDELRLIGRSFSVPLMANMAEAGRTPILTPRELGAMGFAMIVYPATLFIRCIAVMQQALKHLRSGEMPPDKPNLSFEDIVGVLGIEDWHRVDDRFGQGH